jgi:arsenate reductase
MSLTIYHNPRCSKSRKTLEIIRESGIEPEIIAYLEQPPSAATTLGLARSLDMPVRALLRTGEEEFRAARDSLDLDDDAALARWLTDNPKVLQRPVVVDNESGRAIIGRPPENVLELIGK